MGNLPVVPTLPTTSDSDKSQVAEENHPEANTSTITSPELPKCELANETNEGSYEFVDLTFILGKPLFRNQITKLFSVQQCFMIGSKINKGLGVWTVFNETASSRRHF